MEGLLSFLSDMGKMDDKVGEFGQKTSLLGSIWQGVGNIISGLISGVFRVLEFTLGNLLANAIQSVIGFLKDLGAGALEAASNMQILELRLRNLNFNELTESGVEFNAAQEQSIKLAQEQLKWVQRLGATTIFDDQDIANVFTLARSYGFGAERAQDFTKTIVNFTAGMGLSNVEMERIIVNFGQMQQQGKVTQREMNDLARGAFVPVNDVMAQMTKNTGLAGDALTEFRGTAEGVDAFMLAFAQIVETRFATAAKDMARSFKGASENAIGFAKSILGFNILKPVLDKVGGFIADFMDQITSEERIEAVYAAANSIGDALSGIVSDVLGLAPSTTLMADSLVSGLEGISSWLNEHRDEIVEWAKSSAAWIQATLIPAFTGFVMWVKDKLVPAITNDLIPLFQSLIPLAGAIAGVFMALFSDSEGPVTFSELIHGTVIPAIESLTAFITTNRDAIAQWVKVLATIYIVVSIGMWIFGLIVKLALFAITVYRVVAAIITLVSAGASVIAIIGAIVAGVLGWIFIFTLIIANAKSFGSLIVKYFNDVKNNIVNTLKNIITSAKAMDWKGVGKAIVDGIVGYVKANIDLLAGIIAAAIQNAINAARSTLDSGSPSKVFEDIAAGTMEGFALGVKRNTDLAVTAMQKAMSSVTMPAMAAPAMAYSSGMAASVQNTRNYNLTVNSNAQTEPIIQDFGMMQALDGA